MRFLWLLGLVGPLVAVGTAGGVGLLAAQIEAWLTGRDSTASVMLVVDAVLFGTLDGAQTPLR